MPPLPGGHKGRPYGVDGGQCVRRTTVPPEPGGPMWASAPTKGWGGILQRHKKQRPTDGAGRWLGASADGDDPAVGVGDTAPLEVGEVGVELQAQFADFVVVMVWTLPR